MTAPHDRFFPDAESKFRALLESSGDGIWGLDHAGQCIFLNPAGATMLGYRPEEVIGKDMHALVHHTRPDGAAYPSISCPLYAAFRTG
ncbi:MAG: PAS domain-containing protein [Nitrospirota bacterium]|nr:PAS domain-containing protein [Nitrospirota bacterium]